MPVIEFHCDWLNPCPLCNKCRNAAAARYVRCQKCFYGQDPCHHTEEQIGIMIRRGNFVMKLPEETKQQIGELIRENTAGKQA